MDMFVLLNVLLLNCCVGLNNNENLPQYFVYSLAMMILNKLTINIQMYLGLLFVSPCMYHTSSRIDILLRSRVITKLQPPTITVKPFNFTLKQWKNGKKSHLD